MKQTIIVPTDFSKGAWNALQYAVGLGEALEVRDILVLNAYHAPHAGASTLVSIDRIMQKDSEEGMDKLMTKIKESGLSSKFNFQSKSIHSGLVDAVNSQIEDYNHSLTVMGSLGESGAVEKIFGSNASDVAMKANCPVVVIPPNAKFSNLKNVILGSDYHQVSSGNLQILRTICSFDPTTHLQVVHVQQEGNSLSEAAMGLDKEDLSYSVKEIPGNSVSEVLDEYVSTHETDLLVIIKREIGFFQTLLGRSVTKKLTLLNHVPLLVLKPLD